MNDIIGKLADWGCRELDATLERFMGDEDFYVMLLNKTLEDDTCSKLGAALQAGDPAAAFECAHTLKGLLGNMGLTPMYELSCKMVEPLRAGELDGAPEAYEQMCLYFRELQELLK